jgi:CPA1 family monovalent cation:H+ antiporter
VGYAWVKFVQRLGDDYLVIASTALLSWVSYLLGEALHVSGVIATVTTGLILTWHQHTVMSAAMRMRGTSFWTVVVFLMEATVFVLIGLSLREVVERGGGIEMVFATMAGPALVIFLTLMLARFAWVFGCEGVIKLFNILGLAKTRPLGFGGSIVLSWAGIRGVVTLALALSLPEDFPGRDFILIISFAVILGTVLVQGTTLGRIIGWAKLSEHESERPPLTMRQAEAEMAQAQLEAIRALAYAKDGTVVHPQLLVRYERRAAATLEYAARPEEHSTALHAHFDAVLSAVAAGRQKLIGLHRAGEIDEEILRELERDLDLEELSAISAKA